MPANDNPFRASDTSLGEKAVIGAIFTPVVLTLLYLLIIPFTLFQSWATWLMYGWFIQPLGAPELSYWHVVGLFLSWVVIKARMGNEDKVKNPVFKLAVLIFITLLTVGMGSIIRNWI